MKYIRTKDKIFEITKEHEFRYDVRNIHSEIAWLPKNIDIKVADTIEELCDGFVYSDNVFKNVIYENYKALKMLLKIRKNYIVYGAIWTDKGLIYVAKMNEKGELELL